MHLRKDVVVAALAALVAGAAFVVYALDHDLRASAENKEPLRQAEDITLTERLPDPSAKSKSERIGDGYEILYDATGLPEPVQRMLRAIILAAQTGDIEAMRPVLETNELKPMVAPQHVDDPIAYWKELSVDGTGRDILAAMLDMLDTGFVLTGDGLDAMYVWPYFAEADIGELSPEQQVELYRTVPPRLAKAMKKEGEYTYFRLGISPAGVWHYFIR